VEVFRQVDADHYDDWESCGRGPIAKYRRCWYRNSAVLPRIRSWLSSCLLFAIEEATIEEARYWFTSVIQ